MSSKHKATKTTKAKKRPVWIQILCKRHTAHHALRSAFLLNSAQKRLSGEADSRPDGRDDLRAAALEDLHDDRDETVAYALVLLSAVGLSSDDSTIEPFLDHSSDLVRRAAKACRFQLGRRETS